MERRRKEIIMKKNYRTITKTIAILASLSLLTACGTAGATGTASTYYSPDHDADTATAVNIDVEDLGTEEYELTGNGAILTDEEKQEKFILYLEEALKADIVKAYPSVKDADITLTVQNADGTLIGTEEEAQVKICLDLEDELAEDNINEIVKILANATGSTTSNITIQDTDGKMLYN